MRLVQRNERGRLQLGMIIEPRPDGLDIPIFPSQAVRRGVDADEIATVLKVSVERLGLRRVEDSLAGGTQKHDAIESAQLVPVEPRGILCEFKVHPVRARTCLERGDGIGDRVVTVACGGCKDENAGLSHDDRRCY